jgi:AmmeMemoRadiSam system protein A
MARMSLTNAQRQLLLTVANDSINYGLKQGKALKIKRADYAPALTLQRASFVTLEIQHRLRGCIGSLEPMRPLVIDIAENAFAAAFKDPRFPSLTAQEYPLLQIQLSILSPCEALVFSREQDLITQLRPNVDGLIMQEGVLRATFLPSVWQSLPEPKQFLQQLKQKMGLSSHYWSPTLKVYRYQCEVIS